MASRHLFHGRAILHIACILLLMKSLIRPMFVVLVGITALPTNGHEPSMTEACSSGDVEALQRLFSVYGTKLGSQLNSN
ncbi:hypothetical protein BJ166DRAFT_542006 [Pestalotiopsis sp. NC0098]|nr:hypothetical protein BJ166DRAFT_542006 [Pestalotiopsis sp. NC0098]